MLRLCTHERNIEINLSYESHAYGLYIFSLHSWILMKKRIWKEAVYCLRESICIPDVCYWLTTFIDLEVSWFKRIQNIYDILIAKNTSL